MFLSELPISALLICYGPLFLIVTGFIVFAFMTDVDARRSYLRRYAGKDTGGKVQEPVLHTKPHTAETPSGGVVTIRPTTGSTALAPSPTTSITPSPATAPPTPATPPAPSKPDNLTRIEGIGRKMAQALIDGGLDTFEKVAAASIDDFKAAIEAAGMSFAPSAESWAEQASYAAKDDWDGLSALQDKLVSGRYPTDD